MDLERVYEIIAEQCGVGVDEISLEQSIQDDLGLDSLDLFQVIMAFEEEYNIEIPTEDANEIQTVGDIVKYLEQKVEA